MKKSKRGRPRKDFTEDDWFLVDSLVINMASEAFIAERLVLKEGKKVENWKKAIAAKVKHLQRNIQSKYNCNFVQYKEKRFENRKIKLIDKMWHTALGGNVTMMIYLSKQYLGMSDKVESKQEVTQANAEPLKIEVMGGEGLTSADMQSYLSRWYDAKPEGIADGSANGSANQ
jgi:hypothetical protein